MVGHHRPVTGEQGRELLQQAVQRFAPPHGQALLQLFKVRFVAAVQLRAVSGGRRGGLIVPRRGEESERLVSTQTGENGRTLGR